jgi:hypothetical protein
MSPCRGKAVISLSVSVVTLVCLSSKQVRIQSFFHSFFSFVSYVIQSLFSCLLTFESFFFSFWYHIICQLCHSQLILSFHLPSVCIFPLIIHFFSVSAFHSLSLSSFLNFSALHSSTCHYYSLSLVFYFQSFALVSFFSSYYESLTFPDFVSSLSFFSAPSLFLLLFSKKHSSLSFFHLQVS